MKIYIIRDEDSQSVIEAIFFDLAAAKLYKKNRRNDYLILDAFETKDEPIVERFIIVNDTGSEEIVDAT